MPYKIDEDRQRYQRAWRRQKAHRLKDDAVAYLGGKCVRCGIDDVRVLEFDHIIPIRQTNRERTKQIPFYNSILAGEEANVQLLCANCHAIKTAEDFGY